MTPREGCPRGCPPHAQIEFESLWEYFFWKSDEEIKGLFFRFSDNHPFSALQRSLNNKEKVPGFPGL